MNPLSLPGTPVATAAAKSRTQGVGARAGAPLDYPHLIQGRQPGVHHREGEYAVDRTTGESHKDGSKGQWQQQDGSGKVEVEGGERGSGGEGEGGDEEGSEDEWDEEEEEERSLRAPLGKQLRDLYVLGQELGRGHFGVVRRCWDLHTGAPLAVKSIAKGKLKVLS